MSADLISAHAALWDWCRQHDFSGHDPFDALNSKLFQATPLKNSRAARLAWTQLLKRSPINLRSLVRVPVQKNAKGIALFALAALADFRRLRTKEAERNARELLQILLSLRLEGWHGGAWGYNFEWQSRVLFARRGTPTLIPTAFAGRAFVEAHEALADHSYLEVARSVCDFILEDLPRSHETDSEICFSYSPHSQTRIFNASLLAGEILCSVAATTGQKHLVEIALRATRYVANQQSENGSWRYGEEQSQRWVDSFHTAFLLSSLARIIKCCDGERAAGWRDSLRRGYDFWRKSFFLADGWPKYYHDTLYPADSHAAATAIVTLADLRELDRDALSFAETIARWSIQNLRDPGGFFYYQRRKLYVVRTPFMRWTQSWMLYALARLLEEREEASNKEDFPGNIK